MQRAIQEAKNMIEEELCEDRDVYIGGKIHALKELIERLEKLPQEDGWISVKDRLPEEDNEFITFDKRGVSSAWYSPIKNDFRINGNLQSNVTHWQPLPKPPITNQ